VGSKTGRDGIHGATMASEEFSEGSERSAPTFKSEIHSLKKLLLEACLEAMQTGAIVGIQDMGAAGLTCSTCEMGARGGTGVEIELDRVPQRETGMTLTRLCSASRRNACCWSRRRDAKRKYSACSRSGIGCG